MHLLIRGSLVMGLCLCVLAAIPATALAQDATEDRLSALEERLKQQDEEIQRLREQLGAQAAATDSVGMELDNFLSKVEDTSDWLKPNTFRVFWKNGLNMATSDGAFKLKIGGRIMVDWNWMSADDDLDDIFGDVFDDETGRQVEFRRARLYMSGTIHNLVEFKAQYDFAGGDADFKDVWIGLKKLPLVGNFRVGHHKVMMGLEELTSSKYITFMERAGTSALLPQRKTGFFIFNSVLDERMYWGAGYYSPSVNGYGNGPINNGLFARVSGTPWLDQNDDQTNFWHLGGSVAFEKSGNSETFVVSNRPPNHASPIRPISITVEAEDRFIYQLETVVVFQSFSLQAEYVGQNYNGTPGNPDPNFYAFYVYGSWFITGEQRPYNAKYGIMGRPKPISNFWDGNGGAGAWEFAIRYSAIDADDDGVYGGMANSWTFGLNWYLNPMTRVMFNYVISNIEATSLILDTPLPGQSVEFTDKGKFTAFMIRFQIDF